MSHREPAERRFDDFRFILRGSGRKLALLALLSVLTAASETFLLATVVKSIATISSGGSTLSSFGPIPGPVSITALLFAAFLAAVVRAVLNVVVAISGPKIAAAARRRHRLALFRGYLEADWSTQSADKTGRFLQTLSSAVNDANSIVQVTTMAIPAMVTLTFLIGVSLIINPVVTVCIVAVGSVVSFSLRPVVKRAKRSSKADAAARAATAEHVAGVLAAGAEITVFGSREGVFDIGRTRVSTAERNYARAVGLRRAVSSAGTSVAFLFATGGLFVLSITRPDLNFTEVGTVTVLLLRCAGLAQSIQSATSQYGTVLPFVEQVRVLIEHYRGRRQEFGHAAFPDRFDISVDDVSYAYEGTTEPAVSVDHAVFPQGSSVAILGPSGSGKSTLMQLILRLRTPTEGEVRFGDVPASSISEEAFSQKVAYVPQSPHLVPATILENIRFYRPHVSKADIERASRLAHLHEDIVRMPMGYDTMLDSHVDALSGGQKQRLALARALATGPAVLVLDEPTSALDSSNEAAVMRTLRELRGDTTVVVVTHKLTTANDCEVVLLLQHGQLVHRPPSGGPRAISRSSEQTTVGALEH